jgi:alpha/beta superfamily hydrolase
MNIRTLKISIPGLVGNIEASLDLPDQLRNQPDFQLRGLALVAHPHPLMGGTKDNKVAQTLAKTFNQLGYASLRPNFRGVGETEGVHDDGKGEREDLMAVIQWMREPQSWFNGSENIQHHDWIQQVGSLPLTIAGFSFGSYVGSHLFNDLSAAGTPAERLVMVGSAAGKWELPEVPKNTIVIHGENDETIPLTWVLDWARPQELVVQVVPGADHFFHRKLHCIREVITGAWLGQPQWPHES